MTHAGKLRHIIVTDEIKWSFAEEYLPPSPSLSADPLTYGVPSPHDHKLNDGKADLSSIFMSVAFLYR